MKHFAKLARSASSSLFFHRSLLRCLFMNSPKLTAQQSFKYDDLVITKSTEQRELPDASNLVFGKTFSDHMLQIEWTQSNGWGKPEITPLHDFQMHPGAKVLHYGQAVFEGMKAYRRSDSKIALFRPELNARRLLSSSERASLPSFDCEELLKCIKKLVSIDSKWVPGDDDCSLYIRPTMIGTEGALGVCAGQTALLFIITCPVGPYFKKGLTKAVTLLADPAYTRACPGGAGCYKFAANYAPTLYVQKLAQDQGLDQVLWLYGQNHQICEAGAMNVFFFLKKAVGKPELITPPLDGTILPGVTRQSILDLTREWGEFEVSERAITMSELIALNEEKRVLEMFVCGTAVILCPVKMIRYLDKDINLPTVDMKNPLHVRLLKALSDIQYGRVQSEWSVPVD
ncbi:branched-chain-amino-acid aminotransferase, cytosolic [Nephila pilipes]|uniref:Branched-chain-amino-acid aminotransferase n=1 Tax=Nephila pilipes TaxID=299642 RepID=A0A8X6N2S3_NEPPI|nr:branched-chain-amino-acid aminotransferase, cytosolic [Nephila pilipes]GFS90204.1 branched-chain-amino-acid aminotransferase, cytosolic [Nephila pilipes]